MVWIKLYFTSTKTGSCCWKIAQVANNIVIHKCNACWSTLTTHAQSQLGLWKTKSNKMATIARNTGVTTSNARIQPSTMTHTSGQMTNELPCLLHQGRCKICSAIFLKNMRVPSPDLCRPSTQLLLKVSHLPPLLMLQLCKQNRRKRASCQHPWPMMLRPT